MAEHQDEVEIEIVAGADPFRRAVVGIARRWGVVKPAKRGKNALNHTARASKLFHSFGGSKPSAMKASWLTTKSTSHLNAASVKP